MASDSSELTFVRCSSCRSLVPAVSTRCRMCGAPLDASAEQSTSEQESEAESRVRQRTNSRKISEPAAFGGMREARSGSSADSPASGPFVGVAESAPVEMQGPEPISVQQAEEPALDPVSDTYGAGNEPIVDAPADEDPLSAYIKEVTVEEKNAASRANGLASAAPGKPPGFSTVSSADSPAQRVTVESGPRMRGKESNLMFGRQTGPAPESSAESMRARESVEVEPQRPEAPRQSAFSRPQPFQAQTTAKISPEPAEAMIAEHPEAPVDASARSADAGMGAKDRSSLEETAEPRQRAKRRRSRKRGKRPEGQAEKIQMADMPQTRSEPGKMVAQMSSEQLGRLRGWLVDYSDGVGRAIELREGKFFISGSKLKPSDLVINHRSVSTPHAMVQITPGKGFVVQDLMSEAGIAICRKGQSSFVREEEAVVVENGDSIRFGEVEFIVSLIAEVGVK